MAFGFLKRKEFADIIYMNGHLYTQDPEFPWATAVACKDNKIMAVGEFDAMEDIVTEDTVIVDLKQRYMFPGFIDVHSAPMLRAFEDVYLKISNQWDIEPIIDILSDYVDNCEHDVIFGYGFHERILDRFDDSHSASMVLDEIDTNKPIILLSESGLHCWLNSTAAAIVRTVAEDEGVDGITSTFIMHVLAPFPYENLDSICKSFSEEAADKGFTSLFNICAPDYFTSVYMDNLLAAIGEGEGNMRQRLHNAVYANRPLHPRHLLHRLSVAKTTCVELGEMITADFAKLDITDSEGPSAFSQDALTTICTEIAEHGFHIHLDAKDEPSYDKAVQTFLHLREKGYRKNVLVLASSFTPDINNQDAFYATWETDLWEDTLWTHVGNVEEAIDALTIDAAAMLGKIDCLGSIERGKLADFVVFEDNPLDKDLESFSGMHADMTIMDGLIVYDAEEAAADEMCDLLFSMQL